MGNMRYKEYSDTRKQYCIRVCRRWLKFAGDAHRQDTIAREAASAFRKVGATGPDSAIVVEGRRFYLSGWSLVVEDLRREH